VSASPRTCGPAEAGPSGPGPAAVVAPGPGDYAFGSPRYAWFVVFVLCALQLSSNMDRQVISLVVEPLRRDFALDDIQIGLLQGLAFALFYALAAIPIGWAADRWRRNRIIFWGATIWTISTVACMVAPDYPALFVARMLVGLGEAALVPAAFSMLGDYFPRSRVSGAVSVVTGASFFGAGCALAFGGLFLAQLPQAGMVTLPWLGAVHGWQLAFGLVGIPGLVLLPFAAAMREPPRRAPEGPVESASLGEVLRFLVRERRFYGPLMFGMVMMAAYQYGVTAWVIAFFMRIHAWSTAEIGLLYGLSFIIVGTAASLFGGWWCNRLVAAGRRDATFVIPLIAGLVALPLTLVFALNGDARVSAVLLVVQTFFGVISFGPGMSTYQLFAPNRMRAQLTALHVLCSTLIGGGLGPWLTAWFTERVFGDPKALPRAMALAAVVVLVPALASLFAGRRLLVRRPLPLGL
jgi:MFS family permease